MQMMESDEEDEGDAEFAVEISKQELVIFILGLSPCLSWFSPLLIFAFLFR